MKTITLKQLTLKNFKGTYNLDIVFDGSTNVFGANESGKSTINTAFTWLLTGKDEFDRKDYEIKNTKKKELNVHPHEVTAVLFVEDGGIEYEYSFRRCYMEKWTKKKGKAEKEFEGHYTDYFVNGVPCATEKEYNEKVNEIIPANVIKLITNPTYFNSLNWDKQRAGLIAIAGNITDAEIFDAIATPDNNFAALIGALNAGKKIEDYKKELAAKKLDLKRKATEYTPRIDEARRNMPESQDWAVIEAKISANDNQLGLINTQLENASVALAEKQRVVMEKQREVYGKESALASLRNKIRVELTAKQNDGAGQIEIVKQQIKTVNQRMYNLQKSVSDNAANKAAYESQIAAKELQVNSCRDRWKAINAETFVFDESKCECPTCKQSLPAETITAKHDELLQNFNESVASRKAAVVAESDQYKKEIQQLRERITVIDAADYSAEISEANTELQNLTAKLQTLQIAESKKQVNDIETAVEGLMKLNGDALNLQDEIQQLKTDITIASGLIQGDNNESVKTRRNELNAENIILRKQLAAKETIENTVKRINQLSDEEAANAQAIADIERLEFEIDAFTRAKMDILESRVNSMFKYVRFRLFEKQVNGGIAETCVCEYEGVPYPTLNTAAKLLAGLDLLNTLSRFYKIHAPVFCDNRESVSWIPESKSQIISLFVSPDDKQLRVESVASPVKQSHLEFA